MEKIVDFVLEWSRLGLLGAFGGAASYVYLTVTKNRPFSPLLFLANLFVAFFVGKMFGEFIPLNDPNRAGYIMLLGFSAYPVLGILEDHLLSFLKGIFNNSSKQG